jgi:hypothetical protein
LRVVVKIHHMLQGHLDWPYRKTLPWADRQGPTLANESTELCCSVQDIIPTKYGLYDITLGTKEVA